MKLQLKKTNISTQALLGVKGFSRNGIQTNGHGEIVFTDIEEYNATETEPPTSLEDFVSSLSGMRYFITDDGSTVYAYNCEKGCVEFCYRAGELMVETQTDS